MIIGGIKPLATVNTRKRAAPRGEHAKAFEKLHRRREQDVSTNPEPAAGIEENVKRSALNPGFAW
jgi:hypothetical protein